jgi:hypothetical protein
MLRGKPRRVLLDVYTFALFSMSLDPSKEGLLAIVIMKDTRKPPA